MSRQEWVQLVEHLVLAGGIVIAWLMRSRRT
jgi:hypothetical protein